MICSRSKKLAGVTEYSFGELLSERIWHTCPSSLDFKILNLSLFFLIHKTPLSTIIISKSLHVFWCYALNLSVRLTEICLLNHLANGLVDVCWAAQSLQWLSTYYRNPAEQIKKAPCWLVISGLLCYASEGAAYWTFWPERTRYSLVRGCCVESESLTWQQ